MTDYDASDTYFFFLLSFCIIITLLTCVLISQYVCRKISYSYNRLISKSSHPPFPHPPLLSSGTQHGRALVLGDADQRAAAPYGRPRTLLYLLDYCWAQVKK